MRFIFVMNPAAGRVNESVLRDRLAHEFRGHDVSIVHEAPSRASLERADPKPVVVAVGGDGTVQHVLRKVGVPFPCALGILPRGTANDLAVAADIPSDLTEACALLRSGVPRPIDLMEVNGVPFATAGGLGLPVSVARRAERLRAHRLLGRCARWFGRALYQIAALFEIVRCVRPVVGRLKGIAEGRGGNYAAILVSNQPLLGGFRPSPRANPRDGHLDLCAIEVPKWLPRMLWITFRAFRGNAARCREVLTDRVRSLTVLTPRPTDFLGDGEVLARGTRFDIRIRPAALSLVFPGKTAPLELSRPIAS